MQVRFADGVEAVAEVARSEEVFQAGDSVYAWWRDSDEMVFS